MADIKKKLVDGAGLQAAMGIMANYADKGVRGAIGGYNQSFPLTAATKGNIYYHKGTNRYYICVDNYNGSSLTNPNSNFEELSAYTNRQRLENLNKIELLLEYQYEKSGGTKTVRLNNSIENYDFLFISGTESASSELINSFYIPTSIFKTRQAVRIPMDSIMDIINNSNRFDYIIYYESDTSVRIQYYNNAYADSNNRLLIYGIGRKN